MQYRGRCRCGKVLKFRLGPDGYKRRCSRCGFVVRLRVESGPVPAGDPDLTRLVMVKTYDPTEERSPVAEVEIAGSAGEWALRPTLQDDPDVGEHLEWFSVEELGRKPRRVMVKALAGVVVLGAVVAGLLRVCFW